MFAPLRLWKRTICPEKGTCTRVPCPFSHEPVTNAPQSPVALLSILVQPVLEEENNQATSASKIHPHQASKRPASPADPILRPPKVPRLNPSHAGPSSSALQNRRAVFAQAKTPSNSSSSGPPILRINPGASTIPYNTRQTMVTTLYKIFVGLYSAFNSSHQNLARDHAVQQEAEIHARHSKATYRNAVVSCAATIKKRFKPDNPEHPSVGTEAMLASRAELADTEEPKESMPLSATVLEPLLLKPAEMRELGYPEEPDCVGGLEPSAANQEKQCDRCREHALIVPDMHSTACQFHWGRLRRIVTNGEAQRSYLCCSAPEGSPGCQLGPHVFLEKQLSDLHRRHGFSPTCNERRDTQLDIAAIDCEGIYTTQGLTVARVSIVDGNGTSVFDELVRPGAGVEVLDWNTRFSGITSLDNAIFDLQGIRKALDTLIGPETIMVGHSLESDFMMLRISHHPRVIDTIKLFPHERGLPYRRALRVLVHEYLKRSIQRGDGSVGHSSVEDAVATLDLVRHYVRWRESIAK